MPGHGGKRIGSGRKSKKDKLLAEAFFDSVMMPEDLARVLRSHISSDDPRISLDAAKWVGDHMFGRPSQKLEHDGAIDISLAAAISEARQRRDGA
jgi:hypothetical protein